MKKSTYLIALALGASTITFAQNVGINTDGTDPDSDALLHVKDNNADSSVVRVENEQSKLTKFELRNPSAKWDLRIPTGETDLRINNGSGQDHVTIQNDGDVGIGTTTPASGLDVQTSMGLAHAVVNTTPVTLDQDDNVVLVDDAGGDRTINLPPAANNSGKVYYIKKTSSSENEITIDGNGGTIDGATEVVLYVQYDAIRILCDGANWHIIADERNPHVCSLYRSTAQTITNSAWNTIAFNAEKIDVGGIGDITTDYRIEIKRSGNYSIMATWACPNVEDREKVHLGIRVNGTHILTTYLYQSSPTGFWFSVGASVITNLTAGDYVDIQVFQATGSSQNTFTDLGKTPRLMVQEIR